ncbi:protein lin-54 homolog isoform X2 [Echeneis naucrates]|uniref:protein lin-54 homolog isoform X2 n=1 Tax=Echeneis naucrates TaxID=173247 RepID=UPI00111351EE|nr:protein lin-54 homolog isoform X2 [Echeneis naucrates]
MDVVSPELNSLLPDEIMDTEAIEDVPHSQTDVATVKEEPSDDTSVPMETDTPVAAESLSLCSDAAVTEPSQVVTTSTGTDSTLCISSESQIPFSISSSSSPLLTLKPAMATSTATTKTTDSVTGTTVSTSGLQKLTAPFTISPANHQIILNKVATEAAKSGTPPQVIKQEGQKLLVTTIGKSGQPIVLQLPHTGGKPGVSQASGDVKPQTPQFKVVTIDGRSELKPVVGSASNQVTTLQAQQLKAVQNIKPVQSVAVGGVSGSQFKTIIPLATQPNVQQIQVPGSRFHYVRLVTATTASSTGQPSGPSTSSIQTAKPMVVSTGAVRMSVPIVPAQTIKQVAPKPLTSAAQVVTTTQTQQRLIMPATPLPQIQPNFTNLPPGTVLAPAPGAGNVGYAVVPAQYVTQLQQSPFVTLASSSSFPAPTGIQTQARLPLNGLTTAETTSRPRKPCNCTKSQCLKLYCDCFANGEFCNNCNCNNCFNNLEHETERQKAIKTCLDRNPEAFKPKIGKGKEGESDRRHSKGCNCKRSGCLKNYCECYEAKIMCSSICKCIGCKNFEESPERKTLMHLADAAEVRVQQQTAAKTKLSSQISDLLMRTAPVISSGGGRLPYTFVTKEVLEATCECLLEQAKKAEHTHQPQAEAERMILEEFGHCLMRIISSAGKAKADCASINC